MTKRRAALTFENALTKVAGHIGWENTARIVGQAERTVRNWSDPDTTASITLDAALKLDVAFHAAGGDGSPFLLCYATRLEAESLAAVPGREALIAAVAKFGKEGGEAVAATLAAAAPSASYPDFAIAEREIEDTICALHAQLAALRARRKAFLTNDDEEEGARAAQAPEVAQPATV